MSNRLEGLSSGDLLETKAKTNNNENELKTTLEKIRTVLSNNPLPEETASAKVFLDSLKDLNEFHNLNKDQINEETKKKLGNLNDEYVIFQKTKTLLIPIKPSTEASPEVVDNNSNFEKLFAETKSTMILDIKKIVSDSVNDKFKDLKPAQRENIKVAIASKLTTSGIADSLVGGFSGKIKGYGDILAKKDFKSLLSAFDDDKDSAKKSEEGIGDKLLTLLNGQITIIDSFIQKNKTNPNLDNFLNSPKSTESIGINTDINSFKPTTEQEEKVFLDNIKAKIKGYDKKIEFADKTKEQIFDQLTGLPDFITNGASKFIAFFASLPIIGELIKSFLGLKGKTETELETELKSEFESRKSTKNLKEYGMQIGKNGEKTASKKDPKIKILEDKDLSPIKHKQLDKFFSYCKEQQVKTTSADFWYNVLEEKKVEVTTKDGEKEVKSIIEFDIKIEENDFDINKKPKDTFFTKLNSMKTKKPEEKPKESVKVEPVPVVAPSVVPPVVAAAVVVPTMIPSHKQSIKPKVPNTPVVPVVEQVPQEKESDLPKNIEFDSNTSIATIDGKKYKVKVKMLFVSVTVTDFSYSNGSLNITGALGSRSESSQFNENELKAALVELKQNKKFEGSKNGVTLFLSEIA